VDAKTRELRDAHDVLAEFYAERLDGMLERMPAERAVLGLFCELVLAADGGTHVGDIGCGTGRLAPYLAGKGLSARGVDLSPEMVRVARRDQPGFDLRWRTCGICRSRTSPSREPCPGTPSCIWHPRT
jgi:2-polyprenyl-3-methyl-5-hydroxy-6-metoxy-1,4-benzoquinol methylase